MAQTQISVHTSEKHQTIDGFGAFQGGNMVNQSWWQDLFFRDMKASIYRVDLTPQLVSPYSDLRVYSPWFMGSATNSVFNLEDPDNPDGPEGNRVRTYTGPNDYSRTFGGRNAPIAVMGPDIEQNISYFTYPQNDAIGLGEDLKDSLGDFKLIGSIWSPLPWVKVSSGNTYPQNFWPGPVQGTPWPFIWGGNYAGGRLDVTDTPLSVFDDSFLGGDGPTSSLTQFARSTAAYVKGYQDSYGVNFYAISIQNELNFEQFYNSATYRLSSQYIAALKAVRAEFDKHPDLQDIKIMGPEDLLGGDYALWQYGGNNDPTHKNLQYLQNIGNDPDALAAIDFFCIHGYDSDGVSAGTANPSFWEYWKNGWEQSLAPGIPSNVKGYADYGKKSWMTETSGETSSWLHPANDFPGFGGWSVALRIHQALTSGDQSAWIYWTFVDENDAGETTEFGLTSQLEGAQAPKYVAAKHFFNPIRPNAIRVGTENFPSSNLLSSAYLNENILTFVILNPQDQPQDFQLYLPEFSNLNFLGKSFLSSQNSYWQVGQISIQNGTGETVTLPGYSILSIVIDLDNFTSNVSGDLHSIGISDFNLSPNPANSFALLDYTLEESTNLEISMFSQDGKLVKTILKENQQQGFQQLRLALDDLKTGAYNLVLKTNKGQRSITFIVMHD